MASELEMCLDSWRKYCPDYTIKCWTVDNSPMGISWVRDAYKHQKYAFVADYVRFYALYHEGGIYMDTDMLLVRPLDSFLRDKAFLGRESAAYASMGIIGTEKGSEFAKNVLDTYDAAKFDMVNPMSVPRVVTPLLTKHGLSSEDKTQHLSNGLVAYQSDYFYPIRYKQEFALEEVRQYATPNTYGIHLWNRSWSDEIDILQRGNIIQGLGLVWKRWKRTPFLPLGYWGKVIRALMSSTWIGSVYRKNKKKE